MVTFNRSALLDQILSRILSFSWNYSRFIVLNNASTDGTLEVLEKFKIPLSLEIINSEDNVGHGAGLAKALKFLNLSEVKPELVVFLEDDSIPEAGYLDFLVKIIRGSLFSLVSSAGYQVRLGKRSKVVPRPGEVIKADFGLFDGSIARFPDLMKVGYPVENWFMMFDDFEYCYRIRKAGFKIGIMENPYVQILHEGWGGGNSHSSLWRSYYQSRNFILFVRSHFNLFNIVDCLFLISKRVIGGLFNNRSRNQTKFKLKGIWDGIKGVKGKSLDPKTLIFK
jgi:GT2 family glycosyltransferase